VPLYENIVIGNFLFALGLKLGARQRVSLASDLAVHQPQQTPLDRVLGDVLLTGLKLVALLEFKRAAAKITKERSKLRKINRFLKFPEHRELTQTSREIHLYVETQDKLEEGILKSRVMPYLDLDLRTNDQDRTLEKLIDELALAATSGSNLPEMQIEKYQNYLHLVCDCQGLSYNPSPGLLVGVRGDGQIAFAEVPDIRDLRATNQNIQRYQLTMDREITLKRTQEYRQSRDQTLTRQQTLGQRQGL
jgi:hypothetical protein